MRAAFLLFSFVIFSCSSPQKDRIIIPKLNASLYSEALAEVESELSSDPDNNRLVNQKLFYCEQLGWPVDCISALDAYKKSNGMTNQLVTNYITYYVKHQQNERLLEVIDKWVEEYDLKEEYKYLYIKSLVTSDNNRQAFLELRQYLVKNQGEKDILFAAEQYLRMGDSALAAYNLGKVYLKYPAHPLMWDYGNMLTRFGYTEKGLDVLKSFIIENRDIEYQLKYAMVLEEAGLTKKARAVIKPVINERDTATYLLADWYLKDKMWDSAGYVLDVLIEKDSSDRKPIWKAGRLYEERGWFSTSLRYYEFLVELDSLDTLAMQRMDLIQRKIAYLQRQKFEESKIPLFDLKPKKLKINE